MTHRDIPSDISFRLPPEVRPLNYDLFLHPDLKKGTFEGRVSILLDIRNKRKYITLHQKELTISSVNLDLRQNDENHNIGIKESYPLDKHEFFIITPNEELDTGVYNLTLSFSGSLQDKIVGFYSSKYKDEKNQTR